MPRPPPRVRPAIPTSGPQPAGIVSPCSSSASYTSPSRAPAPTVARPLDTNTDRIGLTSITMPSVDERPAKQCPPLRTATGIPSRRASAIASATSPVVAQRATARGRAPWNRGIAALRAIS
jgi:hypothetical protein